MKNLLSILVVIFIMSCKDFGEPIGVKRVAESPGFTELTFYNDGNCILTLGSPFDSDDFNLKYELNSDTGGTVWVESDQSFYDLENHIVIINDYKYIIRRRLK